MEKLELVIGILTYNQSELLTKTVESVFQCMPFLADDRVKLLLFDNGIEKMI